MTISCLVVCRPPSLHVRGLLSEQFAIIAKSGLGMPPVHDLYFPHRTRSYGGPLWNQAHDADHVPGKERDELLRGGNAHKGSGVVNAAEETPAVSYRPPSVL